MRKVMWIAETASLDTRGPYVHDAKVDKGWLEDMVRRYGKRPYSYVITSFEGKTSRITGERYTVAILSHVSDSEDTYPGVPIKLMAWVR